jgi:hypothetical protein
MTGTIDKTPSELIKVLVDMPNDKRYDLVLHRNKRSNNANNYAWELMEQIAQHPHIKSSKDEIYEIMLQRYGTLLREDGELIVIPSSKELKSSASLHLKYIGEKEVNDNLRKLYAVIKGSSQYDTKEMSTFIDGVVYEATELDIDVRTPDEIARLKSLWNKEG